MICLDRSEAKAKRQRVQSFIDIQPKIKEAITIIKSGLRESSNPVIAFSGGKDSLVVLDLVRSVMPNIQGVFENTTNEYPETLRYIKTVENIIELKPEMSFKECWSIFGMPVQKSKAKSHGNQCCIKLKEEPFLKAKEQYGFDGVFTGLTMEESRNRMMMLKRMGSLYFHKSEKIWKCHPIWNWTPDEVWAYIDFKKLQYNTLYDVIGRVLKGRYTRVGCRLCSAYTSHMEVSSAYNEKDAYTIARMQGTKPLIDFVNQGE